MTDTPAPQPAAAELLDPAHPADARRLAALRADPSVQVHDTLADQRAGLAALVPPPGAPLRDEPPRWAYYPWRRALVAVLGPRGFRRLRLDRNRHKITADEQERLGALRIGVVGASAGFAVAHMLALQGLCGELRLADFDTLELSNLNRVAASVLDLGVNKAVAAARRIAETDPYLPVAVHTGGLTPDGADPLLHGLDILVEECDALEIKVLARERARALRIPVLMATSDRGLLDVERFDLEPHRPVLHGLLGGVDSAGLAGLDSAAKVPHVLRILEPAQLSASGAASLLEVGRSIGTWPQPAADVAAGAVSVAAAVVRIGLGRPLASGRVRIDADEALDAVRAPDDAGAAGAAGEAGAAGAAGAAAGESRAGDAPPADPAGDAPPADPAAAVAHAASRAPSGGNSQPWLLAADGHGIDLRLDPRASTAMDLHLRGSAVALGAALYNARAAAAEQGILGPVTVDGADDPARLRAHLAFTGAGGDAPAAGHRAVLRRETNRHRGRPAALDPALAAALHDAAAREGGGLRLITDRAVLAALADVLARSDRLRYLEPRLHGQMIAELAFPGPAGVGETGIDVRSLGLSGPELAVLGVLRRADVMAELARWDAGEALGEDTRGRVLSSSALAIVTCPGPRPVDYLRGGSAVEAVWVHAQEAGLGVQPVSPVFLYADPPGGGLAPAGRAGADPECDAGNDSAAPDDEHYTGLSRTRARDIGRLHREFVDAAGLAPGAPPALILRLSHGAGAAAVRSRRRPVAAAPRGPEGRWP